MFELWDYFKTNFKEKNGFLKIQQAKQPLGHFRGKNFV